MAPQPPPPPPANANANGNGGDDSVVDRDVWLACAVPLSRLPAVGAEVYYFPHGHAEQCPAHLPAPLPAPHLFPCTVTGVAFGADDKTNEVFAKISLSPGPHRAASRPDHHHHPTSSSGGGDSGSGSGSPQRLRYFTKELTPSDANNGGGFSVPRYCADHIFPPLDFEADPPVQNLVMRDTCGVPWKFRHIYRGTPRRHLLTTGWSKFVNAKLLVAGDVAVFMRRADGDLVVGLRRAPRYPLVFPRAGAGAADPDQPPPPPPRNARARVPPQDVMEAARLAAEGTPFTVTYFPRQAAGEFVVPRAEVEEALATRWEPGTQVRMQVMEAEDTRRTVWADGNVRALHQNIWRALEIDWDDSSPLSLKLSRFVNAWQVQLVAYPPLPNRVRICDTIAPLCPGDVSHPLIGPESLIFGSPIPAGMQGARHTGPCAAPYESSAMLTTQLLFPLPNWDLQMPPRTSPTASSEILNPEAASSSNNSVGMRPAELPVQVKSIQLFGATITPHVVQSAAAGGSEEVNGAPNGDAMADDNVEKDV